MTSSITEDTPPPTSSPKFDHSPGHERVSAIGDPIGLSVLRLDREQLAGSGEVLGAPAIGEQPVMADAVSAKPMSIVVH